MKLKIFKKTYILSFFKYGLRLEIESEAYVSSGGFLAKSGKNFDIKITIDKKEYNENKLYGYSNFYYDGYYNYFGLYPFSLFWCDFFYRLSKSDIRKKN
jgi:hypothetical protein